MAAEHYAECHITLDAGSDLGGECSSMEITYNQESAEITNLASAGWKEHLSTVRDVTITLNLSNPEGDESASGILKALMDASSGFGSGDDILAVVAQKVSSGGTGGTATTKDPTYSGNFLCPTIQIVGGSVTDVINQGSTITLNSTGTVTRATA